MNRLKIVFTGTITLRTNDTYNHCVNRTLIYKYCQYYNNTVNNLLIDIVLSKWTMLADSKDSVVTKNNAFVTL